MKILLFADLHLGSSNHLSRMNPETGLPTRLEDFLATFDQMVDYAIEYSIDLFIIAGDLFKTRQPTNTQQAEFAKRLNRLSTAKIEVAIINGNHDILVSHGGAATSAIYEALQVPGITIYDKPGYRVFNDVHVLFMPYAHKGKLDLMSYEELTEWYIDKVQRFIQYADRHQAKRKIVIGHQTLQSTTLLSGITDLSKLSELIVPLDIFEKCDFVLYGHVHKYQVLNQADPIIVIPGSPDTLDFAEVEETKGFIVYDTVDNAMKRVALQTRPLYEIDIELDDDVAAPTDTVISQIHHIPNLQETIVKSTIRVSEKTALDIDLEAIEQELGNAAFALRPNLDISRQRRQRNAEITELLPVEDTLEEYFKDRADIVDIRDELILAGRKIIVTTQFDE